MNQYIIDFEICKVNKIFVVSRKNVMKRNFYGDYIYTYIVQSK